MNRIILIGNGFDLAHGLPTGYAHFIDDYWIQYGSWLSGCWGTSVKDDLCTISLTDDGIGWYYRIPHYGINGQEVPTPKEIIDSAKANTEVVSIKKTPFFRLIDTEVETKNWVDIEDIYYTQLKCIAKKSNGKIYQHPMQLDAEFNVIKSKLSAYLKTIQNEQISHKLIKDCIRRAIYEPFSTRDISVKGRKVFFQFIEERWKKSQVGYGDVKYMFALNYGYPFDEMEQQIQSYQARIGMSMSKHLQHIEARRPEIPDYYLLPDQVLLLNFNYTKMADLYLPEGSAFQVNHIHGELENENNPIIFGYGDELDEDYKTISNLNDNAYLTNIKSIRYLETDNYRRLLSFVDSAPYQIYIMGHSCGNSDRTLLNTLFEHKNCVSIKPYYHLKEDGTDNYIEIIQNISRNFNDMQLMRDRVVNKSYCRPLVPAGIRQ